MRKPVNLKSKPTIITEEQIIFKSVLHHLTCIRAVHTLILDWQKMERILLVMIYKTAMFYPINWVQVENNWKPIAPFFLVHPKVITQFWIYQCSVLFILSSEFKLKIVEKPVAPFFLGHPVVTTWFKIYKGSVLFIQTRISAPHSSSLFR